MLIEFSVGNYRSFKETVTFSMLAAGLAAKDKSLNENNVFAFNDEIRLLKSAAIYGANASGKSNLVRAISFMRNFVLNSSKETQAGEPILVEPFLLSTETDKAPAHFEMVFVAEGKRYRYGLELTAERVTAEWLYHVPKSREARLFERGVGETILSSAFNEGKDLLNKTRDNALFLSVVAQFNGPIAKSVVEWFKCLVVTSGLYDISLMARTLEMMEDSQRRDEIARFVKSLDMGIDDIHKETVVVDAKDMAKARFEMGRGRAARLMGVPGTSSIVRTRAMTSHLKYDGKGSRAAVEHFDMDYDESDGTQKLFAIAGPLLHALREGGVLVVDELDARLHPLITREIIGFFNSNQTNPKNAQLVFATHDTNLLRKEFFRRDQIWFTEKDRFGATDLYSLAEFKVRNDASFGSDYIRGKFGAIPYPGDLTALVGPADE